VRASRHLGAALAVVALVGCGSDSGSGRTEHADPPATPPRGWHTVLGDRAGFTIAAPRRWKARTKRRATLIRSRDRLVAVTVNADRSAQGRNAPPRSYARDLLEELPGFEGDVSARIRTIPGAPYRTARVDGVGSVRTSRRAQRITVAVYQRAGLVTYGAVVFRNAFATPRGDDRVVNRMLRTFRARPPAA